MISPLRLALLFFLFVSCSSLGICRVWKRKEIETTEHGFDSKIGLIATVGIIVRKINA